MGLAEAARGRLLHLLVVLRDATVVVAQALQPPAPAPRLVPHVRSGAVMQVLPQRCIAQAMDRIAPHADMHVALPCGSLSRHLTRPAYAALMVYVAHLSSYVPTACCFMPLCESSFAVLSCAWTDGVIWRDSELYWVYVCLVWHLLMCLINLGIHVCVCGVCVCGAVATLFTLTRGVSWTTSTATPERVVFSASMERRGVCVTASLLGGCVACFLYLRAHRENEHICLLNVIVVSGMLLSWTFISFSLLNVLCMRMCSG